jgi:hypothetical protein
MLNTHMGSCSRARIEDLDYNFFIELFTNLYGVNFMFQGHVGNNQDTPPIDVQLFEKGLGQGDAMTKLFSISALHKKLTYSPWEGTTLLKLIYGQLNNGKLAMRYEHAPTDE